MTLGVEALLENEGCPGSFLSLDLLEVIVLQWCQLPFPCLGPSVGLCSAAGQAGRGTVPVKRSLCRPVAVGHGACPWAGLSVPLPLQDHCWWHLSK